MKCIVIVIAAAGLFFFAAAMAGAQQQRDDVYAKTIPIVKIYGHQFGYKIVYSTSNLRLHTMYVPNRWFVRAGSKGQVVWGDSPEYPYFTVFWRNGEFNLIRLYVHQNLGNSSWGILRGGEELRQLFEVEEPDLVF